MENVHGNKFFSTEPKLDYKDVLIVPTNSELNSRAQVDLTSEMNFKFGSKWTGTPIIASNMDSTGTFPMAVALSKYGILTAVHKHYELQEWEQFLTNEVEQNGNKMVLNNIIVSSGIAENEIEKAMAVLQMLNDWQTARLDGDRQNCIQQMLMIDVANGYTKLFEEVLRKIREKNPKLCIMAGNIVTPKRLAELVEAGVDIVKLGIGPGSVCTTRKMLYHLWLQTISSASVGSTSVATGIGYPQLSCIIDSSPVAKEMNAHIIADGGCCVPGDICKAFAAGADFCMLGGMLAGHDQSAGDYFEENGKKYKMFYGMSSTQAQSKYHGGVANYRASEGKCVRIQYRGDVNKTIAEILGSLRSCCTYTNSAKLSDLYANAQFIIVKNQMNTIYNGQEM